MSIYSGMARMKKSETRACLKNHSCNLHASIYGIFYLHSVDVARARYAALIQVKSPVNCNAHLAESLFQTRFRNKLFFFIKNGMF
ncbi:MAG: DUF6783 domain-containing protein [Anaerobutyricum soehngenii]